MPWTRVLPLLLAALTVTASSLADGSPDRTTPARAPALSPGSMVPPLIDEPENPPAPRPRENLWKESPLVLEVQAAPSSPLGWLGMSLDYSVSRVFAVNAGVGIAGAPENSSFAGRLQVAIAPRIRLPLTHDLSPIQLAIGFEMGLSEGSHRAGVGCFASKKSCQVDAWKHVFRVNPDAVFELRYSALQVRAFLGFGVPLASDNSRSCHSFDGGGSSCSPAPSSSPSVVVNAGLALGVTLF